LPLADISNAVDLLTHAKQPILYVGGGVGMGDAVDEVRAFASKTGMPSVSTLKGLGAMNPDNEHYLGLLGMHGTKAANLAVQACDLLVVVGARFDDRVTGKLDQFAPNAKVIHFDIDTAEINKRRYADAAILGDLKVNLPELSMGLDITEWQETVLKMKTEFCWRYDRPGEDIYAPAVLKEITDRMPKNTCITTDVGQHQMWAAQHMEFTHPSNFLTSGGMGTMGFGLPAAIGAQISRPHDTVIAVSGDGSIMMNIQELATVKRYQVPVKIVLIDNAKLGMVRQWQDLFFDGRLSETDLSDNPDFIMLAEAFDIKTRSIKNTSEVTDAIEEMLNHDGAFLLHVKIKADEGVWPLVPPNTANDEMMEEA
jgi:acetolactate synthase-1/2/3 large subunit